MSMLGEMAILEIEAPSTRGKAAVDAMKRQAEIRELLDRLGVESERIGAVNKTSIREAVGGDWAGWNRLVKMVASGLESDAVVYCKAKWPAVMEALEREADLRKGRGSAADEGETVMRTALTFTQKLMVCLRRIAAEADLDLDDASGNDARCYRFAKKLIGKVETEDENDLDRQRMLHLEVIRLMELKAAEGVSLRSVGCTEGRELLEWVEAQPEIEGKMKVPRVGEGMTIHQQQAAMAVKLIGTGAEEKAIVRSVGVTSRKARRLARELVKNSDEGAERQKGPRSSKERRDAMEVADLAGRLELAKAMVAGEKEIGSWLGKADELMVRISGLEARYVSTDVGEVKQVVTWLSAPHGPGERDVVVKVSKKDAGFLAEGFVQAIRKTLGLQEHQVRMDRFSWKTDAERIESARGQIVMSVEVSSPEGAGRLRGMYKLAKAMCKSRGLSPYTVGSVAEESWRNVVKAMENAEQVTKKQ